jgi:predicted DNA-binding helix-hairpin-helix protein
MRQTGEPQAILPVRHTVRVQLAQAKGMNNEEILREVKKIISGAAAIRVFYSGDIDIIIPDKASKNRAHGLPLIEELKIYKKDYLIKVPSVLLSVYVVCEKGADNTHLVTAICEASRIVSPSL